MTHKATSKYGLFTVNHYDRYQPRASRRARGRAWKTAYRGQAEGRQRAAMEERTKSRERERSAHCRAGEKRAGGEMQAERTRGAGGTGTEPAGGAVRPERAWDGRRRGYGCGKAAGAGGQSKKFGEFENVLLDGREHGKLVDSLGDTGASEYIERLSVYLAQTGRCYKSHYAAILNWWRRDGMPVRRSPAPRVLKPDVGREITPDMTAEELF